MYLGFEVVSPRTDGVALNKPKITHHTSHILHLSADIKHLTPNIKHQTLRPLQKVKKGKMPQKP